MQKTSRLLAMLFVAPLVLVLGFSLRGHDAVAAEKKVALFSLDAGKVDHLVIEGPDAAKVTLVKAGGIWQLPERGDFPADGKRVKDLIEQVARLQVGLPVATSEEAQDRFKVGDGDFERRLVLAAGDHTLATLYVGTPVGTRLTHARAAGQIEIHAIGLAPNDIPVKAGDWEDKSVAQVPGAKSRRSR